jgi:hypothetical protein
VLLVEACASAPDAAVLEPAADPAVDKASSRLMAESSLRASGVSESLSDFSAKRRAEAKLPESRWRWAIASARNASSLLPSIAKKLLRCLYDEETQVDG